MQENKPNYKSIAIIIVAILAVLWFMPATYYDMRITSGRMISEAEVVDQGYVSNVGSCIDVRLNGTQTYLRLAGSRAEDTEIGQDVKIGYSDRDGLYANTSQSVEIAIRAKGNVLRKLLLQLFGIPHQGTSTDLRIVDIQSDGTLLQYYRAN